MKLKSLFAWVLILGTASLRADYPATITADGPLAYYRFEEAVGSTAIADSSGNGFGGDVTAGTATFESPGLFGNALDFAGDTSILTTLALDPSVGDFSIEAIVNLNTITGTQVFVSNQDGTGFGRSNFLHVDGQMRSFIGGATTPAATIGAGDWHHVVLTYDRSAAGLAETTIRIYVDGELAGSSALVAEAADGGWILGAPKTQTGTVFDGIIDELSIWGKRLDDPDGDGDESDSLVQSHYKEFLAAADVIVSYETDAEFLLSGSSASLSWSVSPALTALTIDDGSGPVDVLADTVDCVGSRLVSPTEDTTYTLVGTSPAGTESLGISIAVDAPPVIDSFTSNLAEVQAGSSVDLSWAVQNADTVAIDNGVGAVDPVSGTTAVTVAADTTYTLTASNPNGSVTAQVSVTTVAGSDPTLIAHWRVGEAPNETAGTTLVAEGGATFDGTFVGTPTFDTTDAAPVPGGSTASIVFDGASSVDILGWTGIGGTSSRTVAFWFNRPANQPTNNATIISWGTGANSNRFDTRLSNNNRGGTMRTEVAGSGRDSSLFVADDTWHHAAVVIVDDGSPNIGEAQFYVDGVLDTAAVGGNTAINTTDTQTVRIGNANLFNRPLTGKLDDIRIYSRALSAEEILELIEADEIEFKITGLRRLENGDIEISWDASPGDYSVEYSFDLKNWLELDDPTVAGGESSAVTIDRSIANPREGPAPPRIYYRVKVAE